MNTIRCFSTFLLIVFVWTPITRAQEPSESPEVIAIEEANANEPKAKSDAEIEKKAQSWVESLGLGDEAKAARVKAVIITHLKAVRDWHSDHPFTAVPAGINPTTGKILTNLDRQMIADSTMPKLVHEALMSGLRNELSDEQVEAVLDKYTVGKVAFTLAGYHAIVADLTKEEEIMILGLLKKAREQAVDYKSMDQISAIFKIYKTQAEQYLNSNGRNWKALFKAYVDSVKAKKAASAEPK
jgi:hypothetical protein